MEKSFWNYLGTLCNFEPILLIFLRRELYLGDAYLMVIRILI